MSQLIECVPNFSEGANQAIIDQIADAIRAVPGVLLLNIDIGLAANRTVMTFVGEPDSVVSAAFLAIKTAGELIDMRIQKGEHPRMGATDVCPLIPLSNITIEETTIYANKLARRVGEELMIPAYLYEFSQPDKGRSNLSVIRAGEYEGFFKKIKKPGWQPDFGPLEMDIKRGATVIGARNFLIAYNVNLNTTAVDIAANIAADVRESGRKITDSVGNLKIIPGSLKNVKAIGWYIKEYGKAQVSLNLTNIDLTPIHSVFEQVSEKARQRGVAVTGSELIGLIPLNAMLWAGMYFSAKHNSRPKDLSDNELIQVAVEAMGLDELGPFNSRERIIEYKLRNLGATV